jgi:hypothetical protein
LELTAQGSRRCTCPSARRVTFGPEPVVVIGLGLRLSDRLARLANGRGHTSDLGVVDRLALHLQLVSLPGLGLGHHLGDHMVTTYRRSRTRTIW